jgi:hypothetical protein
VKQAQFFSTQLIFMTIFYSGTRHAKAWVLIPLGASNETSECFSDVLGTKQNFIYGDIKHVKQKIASRFPRRHFAG